MQNDLQKMESFVHVQDAKFVFVVKDELFITYSPNIAKICNGWRQ